jgi:hypothetical protein
VVACNRHGRPPAQDLADFVGAWAVADDVAEAQERINAEGIDLVDDRFKRFEIGVDVG